MKTHLFFTVQDYIQDWKVKSAMAQQHFQCLPGVWIVLGPVLQCLGNHVIPLSCAQSFFSHTGDSLEYEG